MVDGVAGRAADDRVAGAEIEAPTEEDVSGGVDTTTGTTVLSGDGRGCDRWRRSQKACATVLCAAVVSIAAASSLFSLLLLLLFSGALLLLLHSVFIFFFGADDGGMLFSEESELPMAIIVYNFLRCYNIILLLSIITKVHTYQLEMPILREIAA